MEELFLRGIEEFNRRFFFEAHDHWEELWKDSRGAQRLFYQGLIQTAVGFHHLSNGNYKGACSQFDKALAKLEQYLPAYHGVETRELVERVREYLVDTTALRDKGVGGLDARKIPQIRLCTENANNTAIYAGGVQWEYGGQMYEPLSNDFYYIVPEKCTECVGHFDQEQCAAVCPVDCCVPDPNHVETEEVLFERARALHPDREFAELTETTSHFRKTA